MVLVRKVFIALFSIILLFTPLLSANTIQTPTFSSLTDNTFYMAINRPKGTKGYEWITRVYQEVFRRINARVSFVEQPLKRSSVEANEGRIDGEPARIFSYAETFTNLLRVEEPLFYMEVLAYASSPLTLNGWESLRGTSYRIEYPGGMKVCEENLAKVVPQSNFTPVRMTIHGILRLSKKRSDVYIDDKNFLLPLINHNQEELRGKIFFAGIMEKVPLYMYVHKKHQSFIQELAKSIRSVRDEGLVGQYHVEIYGY